MSFVRNTAVTGFTFGMVNATTGAALTGVASAIGKYHTKDGGSQAALSGTIAEEGNGQYSINLTATEMNASVVGLLFTHSSGVPVQFTIKTIGSPADTSTESTLSTTLTSLRKEVGWLWLGDRTSSNWTSDETDQIDEMINSGLRQFYHPPPNSISPKGHRWSFLEPTTTLSTVSGTEDYTLSADFGGLIGLITYTDSDEQWYPIELTGEHRIRILRQRDYNSNKSDPRYAAVRPKSSDGGNGQRFELMLWPMPDAAYTLRYKYHALPSKITASKPYPLGGEIHSETILESCLAIAEQRLENSSGIHTQKFQERLAASCAMDRQLQTPDTMGYNGDPSNQKVLSEQENRYINGDLVKYNNSVFYDS